MQPVPKRVKPKTRETFKPVLPIRHPDTLISSDYSLRHPFVPSYQRKDEKPDMHNIMTMEYQKMWINEKNEYSKRQQPVLSEEAKNMKKKLHVQLLADTAKRRAMKQPPPPESSKATGKCNHVRSKNTNLVNCEKRQPAAIPNSFSG